MSSFWPEGHVVCLAHGCTQRVPPGRWLCPPHWRRVPPKARGALLEAARGKNVAVWRVHARRCVAHLAIEDGLMSREVATAWVAEARRGCEWNVDHSPGAKVAQAVSDETRRVHAMNALRLEAMQEWLAARIEEHTTGNPASTAVLAVLHEARSLLCGGDEGP